VKADRSAEPKPPLAGRQLWRLRFLLAAATLAVILGFAVTLDETQGHRWDAVAFFGGMIAPALAIYVLTARSRAGSILTGYAILGAVLIGFFLATSTGDGGGLESLWVPFLAWLVALGGRALEPRFRSWDVELDRGTRQGNRESG
jgi:peptidoglycan/LPS O-acetylase OafA/YrhL